MNLYGKAEVAANAILNAFQSPNTLPKPLAQIFIRRKDDTPCRAWSWRNQLLVALHGCSDARGFRQWQKVGRKVKKGQRAFYILSPCTKRIEDKETGKEKSILFGFRATAVFGLDQTEGDDLPPVDEEAENWLRSLPLYNVAREWGLKVSSYSGSPQGMLGAYLHGDSIAVGVKNLDVWAHELVHAADHKNGSSKISREIVAQLGGAVLLRILGYDDEADLGGSWNYIKGYAEKSGVETLEACGKLLERTCGAVALILDTAEDMQKRNERHFFEKPSFSDEKETVLTK